MRHNHTRSCFPLVLVSLIVSPICADEPPQSKADAELERLRGDWVFVSLEENGKLTDYTKTNLKLVLKVRQNRWSIWVNGRDDHGGTLTIDDLTNKPHQFTQFTTYGLPGSSQATTGFGIYELGDRTLRYCIATISNDQLPQGTIDNDEAARWRPSSFQTKGKDGWVCYTLKRQARQRRVK